MRIFERPASLSAVSLLFAAYTVLAFHLPFFSHLTANLDGGFNAVVLFVSAAILLFALDFLLYYLLLWCFRTVGKCIVAFTLFGDAVMLYFVNDYEVLVTDEMMGNVFNTQYSEASGFFSMAFVLYVLVVCVLPCIYLFRRKIEYGSWKKFLTGAGIAMASILAVAFGNMKNWPWIDRNSTELGSLLMPWSYIVNSFRYWDAEKKRNVKEIPLPDPTSVSDGNEVVVLMIGESLRRDRVSYYGYSRETNPYTAGDGVKAYVAEASATYTTAGVRAILEPKETAELYEILPNYLQRAGVDVSWRTSNWGEPPVHTDKYYHKADLKKRFPGADDAYDGILLEGLAEDIAASASGKVFVVIHGYTNHGPAYFSNYPPQFEVFTPVCRTVEMSKADKAELDNAYDNSVVYTDFLIHSVIETVRQSGRRGCVLFVSDHGESLGENNLYMHGVPMAMAPKEQIEIPFLVWTTDGQYRTLESVGQHHVFHSVLRFMGIESPALDPEKSVFE